MATISSDGLNGFQNFHDNAIRRKKACSAQAKGQFIDVDEGAGVASQNLDIEQGDGIGDDAGGGIGVEG